MDPEAQRAGDPIGKCGAKHERGHDFANQLALGGVFSLGDFASQSFDDVGDRHRPPDE